MKDIISNDMMRDADRYTIDTLGISGTELMMRASKLVLEHVKDYEKVAIVVGKGNNGGDGICLTKLMIDINEYPDVYVFSRDMKGEAGYYMNIIKEYPNIHIIDGSENFGKYDLVVDCIFGTGLCRDVEGIYKTTIENINRDAHHVISVDIPSGLNGDNGKVNGIAVKADKTISINTYKLGQFLENGKDYVGELVCGDIGIKMNSRPYHLIEDSDIILPKRKKNSHKGTFGQVSIIGGSECYLGAPKLATMGANALMSGAGLVRLCIPREYHDLFGEKVLECTLYPLSSCDGHIAFVEEEIAKLLTSTVIAVGVGVGTSDEVMALLKYLLSHYNGKLIIDADGLNVLSKDISILHEHTCEVILTPHVKEMSRLTGYSVPFILENGVKVAIDFAEKMDVKLLLKGSSTIITDGVEVYIVPSGSPCMAKGGSGDVLTGVISGLGANSAINTIDATYMGAYIAGKAGELAEKDFGTYGALASDTARNVSRVVAGYER